ncbi:hypothetical protein RN001_006525 [Aquatica leii]|uniref:Gamma-interferon-inducible lysosomal thiol reductase n=1 Tax=Aquatica leii TaxID=1421715 RepID=A0AAN7PL79_9COLE|nr:hypothetical protein RN001_006525 [Aquatica leii]
MLTIRTKIEPIVTRIAALTASKSNKHKKLETTLNHLLGRLMRSKAQKDDEIKERLEVLGKILALMTDLDNKCEEIEKQQQMVLAELSILEKRMLRHSSLEQDFGDGDEDDVSPPVFDMTAVSQTSAQAHAKLMPVYNMNLLLLLVALLFPASHQIEENVLKVSVYYESLCPASMQFITTQLYPSYSKISSSLLLDFVPYGKANHYLVDGKWKFTCQHGPDECLGNKHQACGLARNQTQAQKLEFVNCMMSASNPSSENAVTKCAPKLGIPIADILDCSNSAVGDEILAQLGNRTHALQPNIYFLPTIIFNDVYKFNVHLGAIYDFLTTACNALNNQPGGCNG